MLKANVINVLTTFAVLALSFLLLTRAGAPQPAEVRPASAAARATQLTEGIVIHSYPADAIIIESISSP